MSIKRFVGPVLFVVALAACGGGGDEGAADTTVPLTAPSTSSTTTTTTSTTAAPPTTMGTTTTSTAAVVDDSGIELTLAEEGTVEADVERAFWNSAQVGREVYEEDVLDPNYGPFLDAFTGRDLARIQAEVSEFAAAGDFFRHPEESDTQVQFIVLVTPTEALVQVCELDRAALFRAGELASDTEFDSEFQVRFVLEDDRWLREQTQTTTFEPLEGELPGCWESTNT